MVATARGTCSLLGGSISIGPAPFGGTLGRAIQGLDVQEGQGKPPKYGDVGENSVSTEEPEGLVGLGG